MGEIVCVREAASEETSAIRNIYAEVPCSHLHHVVPPTNSALPDLHAGSRRKVRWLPSNCPGSDHRTKVALLDSPGGRIRPAVPGISRGFRIIGHVGALVEKNVVNSPLITFSNNRLKANSMLGGAVKVGYVDTLAPVRRRGNFTLSLAPVVNCDAANLEGTRGNVIRSDGDVFHGHVEGVERGVGRPVRGGR